MVPPRLLADEMLGRLARYLRMLGCDTVYARGWSDATIARTARADHRVLITRDRALAAQVEGAVLVHSLELADQLREVAAAVATLPRTVAFVRCTLCNGELRPASGSSERADAAFEPSGTAVFECAACGHRFWEGTHTAAVRRHVAQWVPGAPA